MKNSLRLLVPIKRVIDYNARIRVLPDKSGVATEGVRMSMNPFCEIAVEEALRLREQSLASDVTAVSIGSSKTQDVLRSALAMGVDKAIQVESADVLHPLKIAQILKRIILERDFNLVMLGKQAIDDDYNQTGQMLAGLLKWPQATFASKVLMSEEEGKLEVHREVDEGLRKIKIALPAIITSDLRLNEPRYATLPKIMKAKKQKIEVITVATEEEMDSSSQLMTVEVNEPAKREKGIIVKSISELVERLKNERKVL